MRFFRRSSRPAADSRLKVILGLGNPGRRYENTRHNVAWWLVDALADTWHFDAWRKDGDARVASGRFADGAVRLVKPQTYMNLSGAVLRPYKRRATWNPATDLLVVVDDVALPLGRFRLRARGSHGGHNGLRSVESVLESREYARLRIGIGPADGGRGGEGDLADFVLAPMSRSERAVIGELQPMLVKAVEMWVVEGIDKAMNVFNRTREIESND